MKNREIIRETLDSVSLQEAQVENLLKHCRMMQERDTDGKGRRQKGIFISFGFAAAVCMLLLTMGAVTVYAMVSHSWLDKYRGSEKDVAYVMELIGTEPQVIHMNGFKFAVEDYVYEKNVGEGYFVLNVSREDGTAPVYKQGANHKAFGYHMILDGISYTIYFDMIKSISLKYAEYEDSICIHASFATTQPIEEFCLYVMQNTLMEREDAEEIKTLGECIRLTESISEACTFTYGEEIEGYLNPFALKVSWIGEPTVVDALYDMEAVPVQEMSIVKTDGTLIPLVKDYLPLEESLHWTGRDKRLDGKTQVTHTTQRYQLVNLLNIHEMEYLLINGEKVDIE